MPQGPGSRGVCDRENRGRGTGLSGALAGFGSSGSKGRNILAGTAGGADDDCSRFGLDLVK